MVYQKKKKKERKKGGNVQEKKKVKKRNVWTMPICKYTRAFLSIKQPHFLSSVFSPFLGENIFVGPWRKHLGPTIYFSSSPPNQTHSKKVFLSIFSQKFFIYPISPPNKHTLRGQNQRPKTRQTNNPPQKTKNHPQSPPTYVKLKTLSLHFTTTHV